MQNRTRGKLFELAGKPEEKRFLHRVTLLNKYKGPIMLPALRYFCFIFLICGFTFQAQAESIDEHVNTYCEIVREPGKKADAEFAAEIARLAATQQANLKSEMIDRYTELVYLLLLNGAWFSQGVLDGIEKIGADNRVKLCRALEGERLELMALSIEHRQMESYCELASQPTQQPNEILASQNAELASKMKLKIKPEVAARFPTLINLQLTAESSKFCSSTQNELDKMEELGTEKRFKLCQILEKERLAMKRNDINYRSSTAIIEALGIK